MSDTPRTDEAEYFIDCDRGIIDSGLGRQLERELNAANDRIKRLKEARDDIFLLAQKHAPEYWLDAQTAFENWRKAKEARL